MSILKSIAPMSEAAAMLLQSEEERRKAEDADFEWAERAMSDNDVRYRREAMGRLADLSAEFTRFWLEYRNRMAAYINEWGGEADSLATIEEELKLMVEQLQRRVRRSFAQRYLP